MDTIDIDKQHTPSSLSEPVEDPQGVSRNEMLNPSVLRNADPLELLDVASSPAAKNLTEAIARLVERAEKRRKPRASKNKSKLQAACGAVLGGVLRSSLRDGQIVYCSMSTASFDGPIPYRQARAALYGMAALGLLRHTPGIRYQWSFADGPNISAGRVSRFEATDALLFLTYLHGISAESVKKDFERRYLTRPPSVPHPLVLRPFKTKKGPAPRGGEPRLPIDYDKDWRARELLAQIDEANAVMDRHTWTGCRPPRLQRVYRGDWHHGGRWHVPEAQPIQGMSKAARCSVLIDGHAVVEIDVSASHLAIIAARAGIREIEGDPYAMPGLQRDAVKAAVVSTLGLGALPRRWSHSALERYPHIQNTKLKDVLASLTAIYPFLHDPGEVLGVQKGKVSLRLQAIEAECLTNALLPLWRQDIPAVPVHDSLIVPATHRSAAAEGLREAYLQRIGAVIRTTETGPSSFT